MILTRYQTFWRRIGAGIIDCIILMPIILFSKYVWSQRADISPTILTLWYVLDMIACRLYYILLHGLYGQTIGKRITGVKVIDRSEERNITIVQAIRRDIYPVIVFFACISLYVPRMLAGEYQNPIIVYSTMDWILYWSMWTWFSIEIITMLFSRRRRALHDLIAGTVVVKKEP